LQKGGSFSTRDSATGKIPSAATPGIRYDLVAKLQDGTRLTRKTIINILTGIKKATFDQFKKNPEEFITKAARTINMEKAASIIDRITYNTTGETYEAEIFRQCNPRGTLGVNALAVDKHIYDYVITESEIEKKFVREMDISGEVSVYAKLPKSFFISTPVGNYSPDWAIAFKEGKVKHTYFIAETKGSMESMGLRDIEKAKIHCAKKHFEKISNNCVRYGVVNSFEKLLEIVR
jgi:type III restriction enzyme